MSQSTVLYTRIGFCGKTYNSLTEVQRDLDRVNEYIEKMQSDIRVLVFMTEPQKFTPSDTSVDWWLDDRLKELLSELEEQQIERFKLEKLVDEWEECHNEVGFAIDPPEQIKYNSYLDGDFVYTEAHPTRESLLN